MVQIEKVNFFNSLIEGEACLILKFMNMKTLREIGGILLQNSHDIINDHISARGNYLREIDVTMGCNRLPKFLMNSLCSYSRLSFIRITIRKKMTLTLKDLIQLCSNKITKGLVVVLRLV